MIAEGQKPTFLIKMLSSLFGFIQLTYVFPKLVYAGTIKVQLPKKKAKNIDISRADIEKNIGRANIKKKQNIGRVENLSISKINKLNTGGVNKPNISKTNKLSIGGVNKPSKGGVDKPGRSKVDKPSIDGVNKPGASRENKQNIGRANKSSTGKANKLGISRAKKVEGQLAKR